MILRISLCLLAALATSCSWDHTVDSSAPALECRSTPPGASITLDDYDTGQVTPYGFDYLVPGEHRLEIRLQHYLPKRYRFHHYAGSGSLISCTLETALGDLAVSSNPPGAEFTVLGLPGTHQTPDTLRGLDQGSYRLAFSLGGYLPDTLTAWVSAGEQRSEVKNLQPIAGWLAVATNPPGATLRFYNRYSGCPSPCTFPVATAGSARHLTATLQGYQPVDTVVTVPPNDTLVVSLTLPPL